MQDGTDADGNPNLVDNSEKGMRKQFDDYDVNSVTVTPHYSPSNKVGEIQKRKFHVINFGLIFCPSWGTMMRANILLEF